MQKKKKYIIISGRVHPGEANGSYMMEGFMRFITGDSLEAQELRKLIVFKVIPMSNPDGVIIGNYRSSLSGNDLNRQYQNPDYRLHPTVTGIKDLMLEIKQNSEEDDPIVAFIDMHGHSRKKNVFIYGPHYPLHNSKYLKMRVLPKLLSDKTQMFRYTRVPYIFCQGIFLANSESKSLSNELHVLCCGASSTS